MSVGLTKYFFQCGIMGVIPCLTSLSALMFGFDNDNSYLLVLSISMLVSFCSISLLPCSIIYHSSTALNDGIVLTVCVMLVSCRRR